MESPLLWKLYLLVGHQNESLTPGTRCLNLVWFPKTMLTCAFSLQDLQFYNLSSNFNHKILSSYKCGICQLGMSVLNMWGTRKGAQHKKYMGKGLGTWTSICWNPNFISAQAGGRASFNGFPLIAEDFHKS